MDVFNFNALKSGEQSLPEKKGSKMFERIREELATYLQNPSDAVLLYDFLKGSKVLAELSLNQQKYNYIRNAVNGSKKVFVIVKKDNRNFIVRAK